MVVGPGVRTVLKHVTIGRALVKVVRSGLVLGLIDVRTAVTLVTSIKEELTLSAVSVTKDTGWSVTGPLCVWSSLLPGLF